jgi:hypothetical protein
MKKFMRPHPRKPNPNLSPASRRVKPAPPHPASIRSADFQAPQHKSASFNEFAALIHGNNEAGSSQTTDPEKTVETTKYTKDTK